MDHVATIFGRQGADAWWTLPVDALVPAGTVCGGCGAPASKFERERDIVDVWFESGASWLAMAEQGARHPRPQGRRRPADRPVPRGLRPAPRLVPQLAPGRRRRARRRPVPPGHHPRLRARRQGRAVLQERAREGASAEGKKSSYIAPEDVIKKSGVEMFRLWVASVEFRTDIPYSQTLLDGLADWYRKYRNTAASCSAAVADFPTRRHPAAAGPAPSCAPSIATCSVASTTLVARLRRGLPASTSCTWSTAPWSTSSPATCRRCTATWSRTGCTATRPTRPTDAPRRSCCTRAIRALATLSAPIMCFTAEDIWRLRARAARATPTACTWPTFPTVASAMPDGRCRDAGETSPGAGLARAGDQGARGVPRRQAQVDRRPRDDHGAGGGPRRARPATLVSWPICASCQRSCSPPAPRRSRSRSPRSGPRCDRCWKHVPALAADPGDVCPRCAIARASRSPRLLFLEERRHGRRRSPLDLLRADAPASTARKLATVT
jgi:hypothetical protein